VYATTDRPRVIAAGNDAIFRRRWAGRGRPDVAYDPRFRTNPDRVRNVAVLGEVLESVLHERPAAEWVGVLEAAGVPCGPVNTVADAVEHPQVLARNMIVSAGGLRMAGNPVKLSEFPDPPTRRPAPELNADDERIRRELTGPKE
jgi:CoA:oxalate CoA-transferase